jgi:L-threonylcarbamoyladenylate synthase
MPEAPSPITSDPVRAGAAIASGALVGLPTETVYGLAADATSTEAVRAIFTAKRRPSSSPLIVHVHDAEQLQRWARDVPTWAHALARAFWPGPMTLVLASSGRAASEVTAGGETVALRVPDHPLALAAIAASGTGVAAPSANRHGAVSPTRAEHVSEAFTSTIVDCILDGGACTVGVESTIIDCTHEHPVILRSGAITAEQIARVTGMSVTDHIERLDVADLGAAATPAPGQARSHYAPRARVELVGSTKLALERRAELTTAGERVVLLLGDVDASELEEPVRDDALIATTHDDVFARELYGALRTADERGAGVVIAVAPVHGPLAAATRDRLQRAAAPRDH